MGTNCLVGIQHKDGRVEYIFIQWDGYIKGVGSALFKYFKTRDEICNLMKWGFRLTLEESCTSIDTDKDKYEESMWAENYQDFFTKSIGYPEYYYIFTLENVWVVYDRYNTFNLCNKFM